MGTFLTSKKMLVLCRLPQPSHGANLAAQYLVNFLQKIWEPEQLRVLQMYAPHDEAMIQYSKQAKPQSKLEAATGFLILGLNTLALILRVWIEQPDTAIFFTSSRRFGLLRDALLTLMLSGSSRRVLLCHHGASLIQLQETLTPLEFSFLCFSGQQKNVKHLFLCDFLASRFNHILGGVDHKVIPNTVFDLDLAAPPAMEQLLVEREKSHPQAIQLLWMGGLIPSKGILILFEAITQLAAQGYRFHLSICGTPTAACSQQLIEEKIEQIGSAYLSYHGIVSGEAKFRFLAQSHAFLLPTFYINECQPLAVIEAMAFGLALITTHHSCLKDMTQDGYNGYAVEEQSVTSLVSQLQRLFELSVTDLSQMMRNSQQVFNQHYSGEAYQNAIEHLIFEQDDRRE